jgi:branched-chain amino acid transport system ATP-binding protein
VSAEAMALLSVTGISVRYGGVHAVQDASFVLHAGESVGIAGPNGAGKSSLINAITALSRASSGRIVYRDEAGEIDVTPMSAVARARLGFSRTFQHGGLIDDMTVLDNVLCGCRSETEGGWLSAMLRTRSFQRRRRAAAEAARESLARVGLNRAQEGRRLRDLAPSDRQLVALARALVARPRVLFLDEVGAGTDPATKERIGELVGRFCAQEGHGVVFVEHDLVYLRAVADRLVFMAEGRVLADGLPDEVLDRPDVLRAYIGGEPTVIGA